MTTRIRFERSNEDETVWVSVRKYDHPTNGAQYKIVINEKEFQWLVIDSTCDLVAATGRNANVIKCKREAKKALEALGINFQSEVGNRKEYKSKNSTAA